jgi:XTP/dITP diphosphohydrolase
MIKEVLYATNNPGKVVEVSKLLRHHGIKVVSPKDIGIDLDVSETGNSLEENSSTKAKAFSLVSDGRIVLSDDTGLEIEALNNEPGIHVRRWKDKETRMTDEEIIQYCLQRMSGISQEQRGAQFRTVLTLALPNGETEMFEGTLRGEILENPAPIRVEGFPFESLFFVPEWDMVLGEVHKIEVSQKKERLNHREKALQKAIPRIRELTGTNND